MTGLLRQPGGFEGVGFGAKDLPPNGLPGFLLAKSNPPRHACPGGPNTCAGRGRVCPGAQP